MTDEEYRELIKRRRLQMLVHSYIYYELNDNIISDSDWSKWAMELQKLQEERPDLSSQVEYYEEFKDWDGSTGAFLHFDSVTIQRARKLLQQVKGGTKTNDITTGNKQNTKHKRLQSSNSKRIR